MKYLKDFECNSIKGTVRDGIGTFKNTVNRFDVGEYVKFRDNYVKNIWNDRLYKYAKIIDDNSENAIDFPYVTEILYDDHLRKFYLHDDAFERVLTPEEIDEFELKKSIIKYNL